MASSVVAEQQDDRTRLAELDRLELALRRLLEAYESAVRRALSAELRVAEMKGALDGVKTGTLDPMQLGARVRELETENESLKERFRNAEALAQRIQARLQFLEEER